MIIRTDSQYSISCQLSCKYLTQFLVHIPSGLTTWIHKWRQNNWRTTGGDPVKNAGIIRYISTHLDIRFKRGQKVKLEYVKGHSGDVGNDGADAMANQGALLPDTPERDWEALEQQLVEQFNEIIPVGASRGEIEILGPEDGDGDDTSRGNAKKSRQLSPTVFETTSSKFAKSPLTPTRSSSAHLSEKLSSSPKKSQPTTLRHISDKKSPLKVPYVAPPFIPVRVQDVNFEVGHLSFRSLTCSIFVRIMQIVYWMISILPMSFQIDTHADIRISSFTLSHCYACVLSSVILYYPYK